MQITYANWRARGAISPPLTDCPGNACVSLCVGVCLAVCGAGVKEAGIEESRAITSNMRPALTTAPPLEITVKLTMTLEGTPIADATDDELASAGTENVTSTSQLLVPPHTPQLSSQPSQHSPDGASGLAQHCPRMSTTVPLPPHTPHASTVSPAAQHRPLPSTATPPPQHVPVTVSMALSPSQHVPLTSTTAVDEQFAPIGSSSSALQSAPARPASHSHVPLAPHTKYGPSAVVHSADVLQWHGPAVQSCCRVGVRPSAPAHASSPTTVSLPLSVVLASTHCRLRACTP